MYDQPPPGQPHEVFALTFPQKVEAKDAQKFVHMLAGQAPEGGEGRDVATGLEVWSTARGFRYRLHVPKQRARTLISGLQTLVRGMHVIPDEEAPEHRWTYIVEFGESRKGMPLNILSPKAVVETILSSMQHLDDDQDEAVLVQLVMVPAGPQKLPKYEPAPRTNSLLMGMVLNHLATSKEEIDERRAKLQQPNMYAVIRLAVRSRRAQRAAELLHAVEMAFGSLRTNYNHITRWNTASNPQELGRLWQRLVHASGVSEYPAQFSESEILALSMWPVDEPNVFNLPQSRARHLPMAADVASTGIVLADSNVPGRKRPIALTVRGSTMHTYMSAPTGGGKSVALANSFAQVIAPPFNCGAMLLETAGKPDDLYHRALNYIPPDRMAAGDVIVVDVTDPEYAVGINILAQGNPPTVASNLQALFDAIYGSGATVSVPMALYHGVMVLMTTAAAPATMAFTDLSLLFEPMNEAELDLGKRLADAVPDRKIRAWWRAIYDDNRTPVKLRAYFRPMTRRLWQLDSRPEVRAIFGQSTSSFDMYQAIKDRKIILVNLSGLGDTVKNLVGAILIDMLWAAIKRGPASPARPFHCFVDEFQNYPNLARDADVMLSEGRGHGLSMWLANQGAHQLDPKLQHAIANNTRNKFVFQTDARNAKVFVSDFGGSVTEDDIKNLGAYEAVGRVVGESGISPPFTALMRPPMQGHGLASQVLAMSRKKYSRLVSDVEAEMERRWRTEPAAPRKRSPLGRMAE